MRRYSWAVATFALCLGACGGMQGQQIPSGARGKADVGDPAQFNQKATWRHDYVLVGQYRNCDQACLDDIAGIQANGELAICCERFSPAHSPAQTNVAQTNVTQTIGGSHQILVPFKECSDDGMCAEGQTCVLDDMSFAGRCMGQPTGGREAIDSANQAYRLHQDLQASSDYHKFNNQLVSCSEGDSRNLCGAGVDDVFASQWWPQSRNGIAWRWVPGAPAAYENTADKKLLSPAEKYDLLANVQPGAQLLKVRCGSNRCEDAQANTVACDSADAFYCVNFAWNEQRKGCPDNPEEGVTCSPIRNELPRVVGPATKWEMENHGKFQNVQPDSWWGHCNGWASYATAEEGKYPREDICVKLVAGKVTRCADSAGSCGATDPACILFRMGDIEALMSELYFSDAATFTGRRCNTAPEDVELDEFGRPKDTSCRDINAGTFHVAVTGMLGEGVTPFLGGEKKKLPFVIDHNWDYQVWNFPLVRFQFNNVVELTASNCPVNYAPGTTPSAAACAARLVSEAAGADYTVFNPNPETQRFVKVTMDYWMVSDGVGVQQMLQRADRRGVSPHQHEMNYILEIAADGRILGGEWIANPAFEWGQDNKKAHPDFLWAAIKPSGGGSDDDTQDSDNPHVNYHTVKALLSCANDASTCGGTPAPNPNPGPNPGPDPLPACTTIQVTADDGLALKCARPGGARIELRNAYGQRIDRQPQRHDILDTIGEPEVETTASGNSYYRQRISRMTWTGVNGHEHSIDLAGGEGCNATLCLGSDIRQLCGGVGAWVATGPTENQYEWASPYCPF